MSEARWTIVFEPEPDGPPPEIRIRRLLKYAGRVLRLKCVSLAEPPPDLTAFAGWVRPDGWRPWLLVCSAATPDLCERLLAESGAAGLRQVLPRGQVPGEGKG